MNPFKVIRHQTANGPRLFVAVDWYLKPDMMHHNDENIILTVDAADQEEFDGLIDELCAELQGLKGKASLYFKV